MTTWAGSNPAMMRQNRQSEATPAPYRRSGRRDGVIRCAYCRSIASPLSSVIHRGPPAWPWYGLDIETDTSVDGLDPTNSAIVAVAVSGPDGLEMVIDQVVGDEAAILAELDHRLAELASGVLVTWNGAAFDLPFIADRARLLGVDIGLRLRLDPTIHRREPLPGHDGAYRARWHGHRHLDGYQLYRADVGASMHLSCGLKPLARFVGLSVVDVDREAIHRLDAETIRRYVASDARLTRTLVLRRLGTAVAAIDDPDTIPSARTSPASVT
jgi:hypothetical protein